MLLIFWTSIIIVLVSYILNLHNFIVMHLYLQLFKKLRKFEFSGVQILSCQVKYYSQYECLNGLRILSILPAYYRETISCSDPVQGTPVQIYFNTKTRSWRFFFLLRTNGNVSNSRTVGTFPHIHSSLLSDKYTWVQSSLLNSLSME